ncbi:hypothetical protein [Streptomyces sp. NPDC005498]|uniref:hypothetical protein n=1 Tax=Streptomyces sp. NPDC005498 TaxID=3364717 RepID=UPI0036D0D3F1
MSTLSSKEPPPVVLVLDPYDDAVHTHGALAAHDLPAGRVTLHPGPGTTSDTALAHDLLAALGKPPQMTGRFRSGRQPVWEAATAWIRALPVTRLTVLRAHRLTDRRLQRLLRLRDHTGVHLTLVCHRPRIPVALHQALLPVSHTRISTFESARGHYYGTPTTWCPPLSPVGGVAPGRWITLPALDRLISYDSPSPCHGPCTPPPIDWRHRPPPKLITPATAAEVARRIHASTAHPRLAAALAGAIFTGASFQQLATARTEDSDGAAVLALHDPTRYTDGCAAYPVPEWARVFLRAAVHFAQLAPTEDQRLLASLDDRALLLRSAEAAKLRPPQPPAGRRTSPRGHVEWTWREREEAERHSGLLTGASLRRSVSRRS